MGEWWGLGEVLGNTGLQVQASCRSSLERIVAGIPSIGAESIDRVGIFDFTKAKYVPLEFYDGMKTGSWPRHRCPDLGKATAGRRG